MVDFTALRKLARTFDVMIEDLVEIIGGIAHRFFHTSTIDH